MQTQLKDGGQGEMTWRKKNPSSWSALKKLKLFFFVLLSVVVAAGGGGGGGGGSENGKGMNIVYI